MTTIHIIIALAIIGFGIKFCIRNVNADTVHEALNIPAGVMAFLVLLGYIFVVAPSFGQIEAGHKGVVLHFGGVTGQVFDEGLYFVVPFVNTVAVMDVQVHAIKAQAVEAASHDLQNVKTDVVLNYRLDARHVAEIYRTLRHDYDARVISPAIQEVVKANTANYEAEKLITNRGEVKAGIDAGIMRRLAQHGILVDTVNITNFDFSPEFNASIEQKVVAEQLALKAVNDLVRIRTEAEQVVARATAEAEAIRIRALALRENPQLVALNAVEKWDGHLPQYMFGDAVPFIQVPR
jgi:regulator of protease activity HflC (stomatin/prohibitin superfamily)